MFLLPEKEDLRFLSPFVEATEIQPFGPASRRAFTSAKAELKLFKHKGGKAMSHRFFFPVIFSFP